MITAQIMVTNITYHQYISYYVTTIPKLKRPDKCYEYAFIKFQENAERTFNIIVSIISLLIKLYILISISLQNLTL